MRPDQRNHGGFRLSIKAEQGQGLQKCHPRVFTASFVGASGDPSTLSENDPNDTEGRALAPFTPKKVKL